MKITGTATFEAVTIRPTGESVEVEGEYLGDVTAYDSPRVLIDGMVVDETVVGEIRLERQSEQEWVMVEAKEHELEIYLESAEE